VAIQKVLPTFRIGASFRVLQCEQVSYGTSGSRFCKPSYGADSSSGGERAFRYPFPSVGTFRLGSDPSDRMFRTILSSRELVCTRVGNLIFPQCRRCNVRSYVESSHLSATKAATLVRLFVSS